MGDHTARKIDGAARAGRYNIGGDRAVEREELAYNDVAADIEGKLIIREICRLFVR